MNNTLHRRIERLNQLIENHAPSIIIKYEMINIIEGLKQIYSNLDLNFQY